MRVVFMGSADFSVPSLYALHDAGYSIVQVYCQPPRPSSRGMKVRKCAVHEAAERLNLPVHYPVSLRKKEEEEFLKALQPDIAIIVSYGLILPQPILEIPKEGCFNIHASLLPRWRGASPIQQTILAGDNRSGVTIMQMDQGVDTGDILLQKDCSLKGDITAGELHDMLSFLGAEQIKVALEQLQAGKLIACKQESSLATLAPKLKRDYGHIDWSFSAEHIERMVRAFTPWPSAFFYHNNVRIKLLEVTYLPFPAGEPSVVLETDPLIIACGEGSLRIEKIQRAGKGSVGATDFLRGYCIEKGEKLEPFVG